jgi:hypothetical protein
LIQKQYLSVQDIAKKKMAASMLRQYLQFPAMFLVILDYNWWVILDKMETINILISILN